MARDREVVIQVLLALLIVTPALALGAVHPSVLAVYLIPAAALCVYLLVTRRVGTIRLDVVGIIFLVLAGFTLLQILPLPSALVELLSPEAYEVRSRALRPLGAGPPSFMPLTLDATLTMVELGKLLFYLSVYWACLSWTRRHGSRYVLNLVIATGVCTAAVFLVHKILLLDKVYGLYEPIHVSFGSARSCAPLINENHMAALLGICSAVTIGRALTATDRSKRILLIGLAGLIGGSLLLTMSRGGIAAFIGGQFLFVLLRVIYRLAPRRQERRSQHLAWLPIGLTVSLGLGLFTAQDAIIGEFVTGDTKKVEIVLEGLPLIGRFFATGVGRGAFWVGFPLVSDITMHNTFTHAENVVIQLLADYGVLFGALALIGITVVVGRYLLRPPSKTEHAAAVAALVAFGLHNLMDFNSEVPGVAVLAVALLGALQGNRPSKKLKWLLRRRILALVAAGALVMVGVIGLYCAAYNIDREERAYRQAWAARDSEPFSDENLTAVLSRHPADWYIPFLVGVRHFHLGSSNPLPWFARAIELNSAAASAHLYVGRTFLGAGKLDQAMLEFRLAALANPAFARPVADFLVSKTPEFQTLSRIAAAGEDKLLLWGALAGALARSGHDEQSEKADKALLGVYPLEPHSLARQSRRLARRGQKEEALSLAQKLGRLPGYGPPGSQLQAEILEQQGERERAIEVLEEELTHSPKHSGILTSLAWMRQRAGDYAGALRATGKLKAAATNIQNRANVAVLEARLSVAEGRVQAALASYRQAHALDPANTSVLRQLAGLAERHGDKRRAIEALRKLSNAIPGDEAIEQRLRALEEEGKQRKHLGVELPK